MTGALDHNSDQASDDINDRALNHIDGRGFNEIDDWAFDDIYIRNRVSEDISDRVYNVPMAGASTVSVTGSTTCQWPGSH